MTDWSLALPGLLFSGREKPENKQLLPGRGRPGYHGNLIEETHNPGLRAGQGGEMEKAPWRRSELRSDK